MSKLPRVELRRGALPIPEVTHDRAALTRFYDGAWHDEPAYVTPCGVVATRETHQPRVVNFNYATGEMLPQQRANCPGCIEAVERHSRACAAVRYGT